MKQPRKKDRITRDTRAAARAASSGFRIPPAVTAGGIALLALLVYANSLDGKFVFDDTVIVEDNPAIQSLDLSHLKGIFGQHYWQAVESRGGLYRPLVMLTYAINYAISGSDPTLYHLANVILHALNGVLVFFLIEAIFARREFSLLTALFFVFHPIRTEGVASIVGRAESLSACFILAAWLLYIRHHKRGKHGWLWISAALFVLAVLSKESAFAFVAVLPLTDYLLGLRKPRTLFFSREALMRYLPFVLAVALVLLVRFWVLGGLAPLYINPRSNPLVDAPAWSRFLTANAVFGKYLWLLVWPVHLSADYSFNQIPLVTTIQSWSAILPLLLLALLFAGTLFSLRRYPEFFFSGSVFFSFFILTSNWIWPIGTIMGERLMYLPSLGFNCALAFALCRGRSMPRWRTLASVAAGILLAGYALKTVDRNIDWRDHLHLFESAVLASPGSSLVQSNYATILLHERKDPAGAIRHARKAIEIMPQDPAAHFTLGQASRRIGDLPAAAAAFENVVKLAPRTDGGTNALREEAQVEETMARYDEALASYEMLLDWRPSDVAGWLGLSRVCRRLGRMDRAREALDRCATLAPNDPAVQRALREFGAIR